MDYGYYESKIIQLLKETKQKKVDRDKRLRWGIGPAVFLQAVSGALPDWMRPQKVRPSWTGIEAYARRLIERSEEYSDPRAARQMEAAGQDILGMLPRYRNTRHEASVALDWDFCPLCWRPVQARSHLLRPAQCRLHQPRSAEYQKIDRTMRKLGYSRRIGFAIDGLSDRLPVAYSQRARRVASMALEKAEDLQVSWDLFPHVRDLLNRQGAGAHSVEDCFKALARPEPLPLPNASICSPLLHSEQSLDAWLGVFRPMLIRAEAWLQFLAEAGGCVQADGAIIFRRGRPNS